MRLNYITCETCKGRGEFLGSECKACRGRGQIPVMVEDNVSELISKAHADGIREGISIAVNAIEKSKSDISESVTKAILDVLQKDR